MAAVVGRVKKPPATASSLPPALMYKREFILKPMLENRKPGMDHFYMENGSVLSLKICLSMWSEAICCIITWKSKRECCVCMLSNNSIDKCSKKILVMSKYNTYSRAF